MEKKPSLLNWFAYMFTPFGGISGPIFEYKLFEYILDIGNRKPIESSSRSRKTAKSRWLEALFWGTFNYFFFSKVQISFYSQPFYVNANWFVKLILMLACTCGQACKYFPAWSPVEAGIYETGVAECDLIEDYYDVSNLTILDLLKSESIGIWLQRWNHSSHIFFKHYVFYPLLDGGYGYAIAHHSVFIASAIWHGFDPVYYLLLPEMICSTVADNIILRYCPFNEMPFWGKLVYHFWVILAMFNSTSTFWYRTSEAFFFVRRSNNYIGTIITVAVFVFCEILTLVKRPPKRIKKDGNEKKVIKDEIKKEIAEDEHKKVTKDGDEDSKEKKD